MSDAKSEAERLLLLDLQVGDILKGATIHTNEVAEDGTFAGYHLTTGQAAVYKDYGLFHYGWYDLLKFYVGRQERSGAHLPA